MKKIFTGLLVCFLTVFMTVSSVNALDVSKVDEAYKKVVEYYEKNNELDLSAIIAVEALGLEAENGDFKLPEFNLERLKQSGVGTLGKNIVALSLIGKNPTNFEGTDLVEILKQGINSDGSIQYSYGMSNDVWVLFALETVGDSDTAKLVADYLASNINTDGGFWDYGYDENWALTDEHVSSLDTTGWVIEALSIIGKEEYQESINKAIEYLKNNQADDNASFVGPYGANTDTQACVLEGLLVYNQDIVIKTNEFDKNGTNPMEFLLSFQTSDGGFGYVDNSENNSLATQDAARCLGTYKNGSVIFKAQDAYKEIINNEEDEPTKEPEKEQNPSVDVEEAVSKNPVTIENSQQTTTEKDEPSTKTENAKPVETSDSNDLTGFVVMAVVSGGLFIALRKKDEEIC